MLYVDTGKCAQYVGPDTAYILLSIQAGSRHNRMKCVRLFRMGNLFAITANWTTEPREITENDFYSTFNYSSDIYFFFYMFGASRTETRVCARKCVSRRQHPNALLPRKNESKPLRALNWFVRKSSKWTGIRLAFVEGWRNTKFSSICVPFISNYPRAQNICPDFVHPNNRFGFLLSKCGHVETEPSLWPFGHDVLPFSIFTVLRDLCTHYENENDSSLRSSRSSRRSSTHSARRKIFLLLDAFISHLF